DSANSAVATALANAALDDVTITGGFGEKPTVTMPKGFKVSASVARVLVKGDGEAIASGNKLTVDYVALKGSDGSELDSTFGAKPTTLTLDDSVLAPLVSNLVGTNVGSRVVVAVAPADGYGDSGQSNAGIGPDETLVFIID